MGAEPADAGAGRGEDWYRHLLGGQALEHTGHAGLGQDERAERADLTSGTNLLIARFDRYRESSLEWSNPPDRWMPSLRV
jgi:hypothetical protein